MSIALQPFKAQNLGPGRRESPGQVSGGDTSAVRIRDRLEMVPFDPVDHQVPSTDRSLTDASGPPFHAKLTGGSQSRADARIAGLTAALDISRSVYFMCFYRASTVRTMVQQTTRAREE